MAKLLRWVDGCLVPIHPHQARLPDFSHTTEGELWKKLSNGTACQIKDFIRHEIYFRYESRAKAIAHRYCHNLPRQSIVSRNDVVSSSCVGLLQAINKYDADVGVRFRTFMLYRVLGEILDLLRSLQDVPRDIPAIRRSLGQEIQTLANELGFSPTIEDIREHLGDDVANTVDDTIFHCRTYNQQRVCDCDSSCETVDLSSVIPDTRRIPRCRDKTRQIEQNILAAFDEDQEDMKFIISARYFLEWPHWKIAKILRVSVSAVSNMHKEAIQYLRKFFTREELVQIEDFDIADQV